MAKYRIFTVGSDLPGESFEYVPFESDQTLLDADIVLFTPTLGMSTAIERYNGKPLLSEGSSFSAEQYLSHWRTEIAAAASAGRLVIVFLPRPQDYYRYTGGKEFSGTGRGRVTTNLVAPISSYDSIPGLAKVNRKRGSKMLLSSDARILHNYWDLVSKGSNYEVEIEGKFSQSLITAAGKRIVGASIKSGSGWVLYLPALPIDEESFTRYDEEEDQEYWNEEGLKFGGQLTSVIVKLFTSLKAGSATTPPPDWVDSSDYRFPAETEIEAKIQDLSNQLAELKKEKSLLENDLKQAGSLRALLYEQGMPLEASIIEALGLMGFEAQRFDEGDSEFDAVFVSDEGRCLGEAEGKDKRKVNIDKFSQLERNLQEDFARDEVSEYAKGVLFGNASRLKPVEERGAFFTQKCITAAERIGAALVRTPDLFEPAQYLKQKKNRVYAKRCRKCIFDTAGKEVEFPEPPKKKKAKEKKIESA